MRGHFYVRRDAKDLRDENGNSLLPNQGIIVKPIALNGTMARYERLEREFYQVILEERVGSPQEARRPAKNSPNSTALYAEAGVAKAAATVEYVKDLTDQGRKVIVFYVHTAVHDAIAKNLVKSNISYVSINGDVTDKVNSAARTDAINQFQTGDAMVVLAQYKAAGMCVTLTAAAGPRSPPNSHGRPETSPRPWVATCGSTRSASPAPPWARMSRCTSSRRATPTADPRSTAASGASSPPSAR